MDFKNIIGFLFFSSLVLCGAELNSTMLQQSKYIDHVKLTDGSSYFEYQNSSNTDNVIDIPDNPDIFTLAQSVNFYDDTRHNGIMGIFELAGRNRYFNASYFDTIKFNGKCSGCKVAISDKNLFEKEDNLILGKYDGKIDISSLSDKLDLGKLKYIVLFASKRDDVDIKNIIFERAKKSPVSPTNAVWIWSSKDIDIEKLKKNNIKTVYLQIDQNLQESADLLDKNGIAVYALDGDPSYIFDDSRLISDIERIAQINKTKKIINGFQIDVEPHTLKDFSLHPETYLEKLVILSKSLSISCRENGLVFSIVMPFWYDTVYSKKKNIAYSLIDIADEAVLMSYRTNPAEFIKASANKLIYGEFKNKKVKLGIELMPIADEQHFIYDAKEIIKCQNITNFPNNCKNIKPIKMFTVKGSDISFYGQKTKVKQLLDLGIDYGSFGGFVFHSINGL